jgi:ornithine decarboxylase
LTNYQSASDIARAISPEAPVLCLRPHAAERAAQWFTTHFPGRVFYAVKANPSRWLIEALMKGGIDHFDVASIEEVRKVRRIAPEGTLAFMNPIKSPEAIAESYFEHGVRIYSLDSHDELDKIRRATNHARDLTLCVRLQMRTGGAMISLGSKFGVEPEEEASLLQATRQQAERLGICFHVGSQSMIPDAFGAALKRVSKAVVNAGVLPDIVDVGGGFPAIYPNMTPQPMQDYIDVIRSADAQLMVPATCELWCEPGRALSAEATSLIVRVEHRRGNRLHINDGVYGALADAGALGWVYPARLVSDRDYDRASLTGFSLYGPTCDDADHMKGPFMLPNCVKAGDHIEFGNLGAYGTVLKTGFNGFGRHEEIAVADMPFGSIYDDEAVQQDHGESRREV